MDDLWLALRLLGVLTVANNAPIAAKLLLGPRCNRPIDSDRVFLDGRPLLGRSKTWRGLAAAIALSTLIAPALGFGPATGALIGALAMAGDALASFAKRRLGVPPSGKSCGHVADRRGRHSAVCPRRRAHRPRVLKPAANST